MTIPYRDHGKSRGKRMIEGRTAEDEDGRKRRQTERIRMDKLREQVQKLFYDHQSPQTKNNSVGVKIFEDGALS